MPDPASAFQRNVSGPSELIDHAAVLARGGLARTAAETVVLSHVGAFTPWHLRAMIGGSAISRQPDHASIDAAGRFRRQRNWGYDGCVVAPDSVSAQTIQDDR